LEADNPAGGNPFSLRLGDEDDDLGHRDFPGISGWGWLEFRKSGTTEDILNLVEIGE